jgi:hypothetical protein
MPAERSVQQDPQAAFLVLPGNRRHGVAHVEDAADGTESFRAAALRDDLRGQHGPGRDAEAPEVPDHVGQVEVGPTTDAVIADPVPVQTDDVVIPRLRSGHERGDEPPAVPLPGRHRQEAKVPGGQDGGVVVPLLHRLCEHQVPRESVTEIERHAQCGRLPHQPPPREENGRYYTPES